MTLEQSSPNIDVQESIVLKLDDQPISSNDPWSDDLLSRKDVADRLTGVVKTQSAPLTVSLHGQWGTGKTFLLKRWQKSLESSGYQAVYFNAWEDDFCDEPLLSIVGQLADHFKEPGLRRIARQIAQTAMPLITENALGLAKATLGVTLKVDKKEKNKTLLDRYLEQTEIKRKFKSELASLSATIVRRTQHPLVFIVDELDRCRPTFAIELLEQVKHIFDIPSIVFVFGINRDELAKSFASVYGEINTDIYLRRFFDFEFNLTEIDSRRFAEYLIDKFQLEEAFQNASDAFGTQHRISEYLDYKGTIPRLWSALGLSLRDIDYGIRLLALLAKNLPPRIPTHPGLMSVLIGMKFKKPEFYHSLATGDFRASEIIDYIDEQSRHRTAYREISYYMDYIEGFLHCAENTNSLREEAGERALKELEAPSDSLIEYEVISRRAQAASESQRMDIAQAIRNSRMTGIRRGVFATLTPLIDTWQTELRR